jgi:hypothetical protein
MLNLTSADIRDLPARCEHYPVPELPFEMIRIDGYTEERQRAAAIDALKELRRYVAKAARWQIACARYSSGRGDQPKLSSMPSKTAGKQSYSKSYRLAALLGFDALGAARCHALIDQYVLVLRAQQILGA